MTEENLIKNSRETVAFPFLRRPALCVQRVLINVLKKHNEKALHTKADKFKIKKQSIKRIKNNAEGRAHIYCKGRGICCCKVLATHDG